MALTYAQRMLLYAGREVLRRHAQWRDHAESTDRPAATRWAVYWRAMRMWEVYLRLRSELYPNRPRKRWDPWA